VKISEPFLGDDPFVMYLGDNLLNKGITSFVEEFRGAAGGADPARQVPDPQMFGVAELATAGSSGWSRSRRSRSSDLALVGVYMFGPEVFESVRGSPRASQRARDHRRDPGPDRPRPRRSGRTSSTAGGRTPASSRTCSRPTG
jgi:dTDP-glucose pyrophosphorylase